ncbi:MAG: hypothetical protein IT210_23420 [Armatimonadetes bacterium]|nr:hypothetical protein [Armatimonadota bacterium]
MSHYLVSALPKADLMENIEARLAADEFMPLRPFGRALSNSLRNARRRGDGLAVWEEEDYCRPPLAQEREAVLDRYFGRLQVEPADLDEGWERIADLSPFFPTLTGR